MTLLMDISCFHQLLCCHFCFAYNSWSAVYRLGHREQKDEWAPRRVDVFQRNNILPPNAIISAGSVNSACTAGTQLIRFQAPFLTCSCLLLDEAFCVVSLFIFLLSV